MNKPFEYNLTIYKGQDLEETFTYKAGDPPVAVDLTGYTARMQIKKSYTSGAVATLTTENGGIILGGAAGTVGLYLSNAATSALAITAGVYDLELVAPSGRVRRFMMGEVEVSPEVTKTP